MKNATLPDFTNPLKTIFSAFDEARSTSSTHKELSCFKFQLKASALVAGILGNRKFEFFILAKIRYDTPWMRLEGFECRKMNSDSNLIAFGSRDAFDCFV